MFPPDTMQPLFLPISNIISYILKFSGLSLFNTSSIYSLLNPYLLQSFSLSLFNKNFTNSYATSVFSNTVSFIVPVNASFNATSSLSNFGHNTPGVSNNSIFSFIRIHCFCFVTPGLFPTSAVVLFAILFINDDLTKNIITNKKTNKYIKTNNI